MLTSRPDCPDLGHVTADRLLRSLRRAWSTRDALEARIDRELALVCDTLGISHRAAEAATRIPKSSIGYRLQRYRASIEGQVAA